MQQKSFTLIEILIVIVIIGILSSFMVFLFSNVIDMVNDAKRKHDIDSFQKILLAHKNFNGSYPIEEEMCGVGINCVNLYNALVPDYISQFPIDPDEDNYYQYISPAPGNNFTIQSTLSDSQTYGYSSDTGFFLTSNGVCGLANGGSFDSPPSYNLLCSAGTPSSVTTTSPYPDYIWTCSVDGGTTANCTANIAKLSPCGSLGDADGDSFVTKNDQSLAYYCVSNPPFLPGADVNNNLDCDYDDVVQIYGYLIGGQSTFSGCP